MADLSWLRSRGYALDSALKLVGDRFQLVRRQRLAVMRSACSDAAMRRRRDHQLPGDALRGRPLVIDGYNVLTTVEAALGGGVLIRGRDGCLRDMSSMHGSYRKVAETTAAAHHLGETLVRLGASEAVWYLDRPVGNSGRLRKLMQDVAVAAGWPWRIELADDPDAALGRSQLPVASADSVILDHCACWFNLGFEAVYRLGGVTWIELGSREDGCMR